MYQSTDRRLSCEVAVKVLDPRLASTAARRRRFHQEAILGANLRHENLIPVTDIGTDCGPTGDLWVYLVMPLVDGVTLREVVFAGDLHWVRCVELGLQIFHGLAELHRHGALHRDLKLTNCMVTRRSDGTDWVRLLDFGLAKTLAQSSFVHPLDTSTGVVGTCGYMAPERIMHLEADERADIYAVGVMLYELLTRRQPYEGTEFEVLSGHVAGGAIEPIARSPGRRIPASVNAFVMQCLAVQPSERPSSAYACISELETILAYDGFGQRTPAAYAEAGICAVRAGLDAWSRQDYAQAIACALDARQVDPDWGPLVDVLTRLRGDDVGAAPVHRLRRRPHSREAT